MSRNLSTLTSNDDKTISVVYFSLLIGNRIHKPFRILEKPSKVRIEVCVETFYLGTTYLYKRSTSGLYLPRQLQSHNSHSKDIEPRELRGVNDSPSSKRKNCHVDKEFEELPRSLTK